MRNEAAEPTKPAGPRDADAPRRTRAGTVALAGPPNAGKSTLLNALLGEKLSIVSSRAQTTREPVTGILTTEDAQLIFVDTPGLLEPKYALQEAMYEAALAVLRDADTILLLLDGTRPGDVPTGEAQEILKARRSNIVAAVNKTDIASSDGPKNLGYWVGRELGQEAALIAAASGEGVDALRDVLIEGLPEHPFYYDADELATQPVRFFVTELVRETVFEEYEQEVPYSTAVRIEEFREADDPVYIRATVYVERDSQKAIVIGEAGQGIKRLGERARRKIEEFLDRRVYLALWVKTMPNWRRRESSLRHLGYPVWKPRARPGRDESSPRGAGT